MNGKSFPNFFTCVICLKCCFYRSPCFVSPPITRGFIARSFSPFNHSQFLLIEGLFLGWVSLLPPPLYHNSCASIYIFIVARVTFRGDGGGGGSGNVAVDTMIAFDTTSTRYTR